MIVDFLRLVVLFGIQHGGSEGEGGVLVSSHEAER